MFSWVEHHLALPDGDLDLDHLGGDGSVSISAAQPVGTIGQLADYLLNGYWTQFAHTTAHHWFSNVITYNLGNLNASEQSLALTAMADWSQVANIAFVAAGSANINFNHNGSLQASTGGIWSASTGQMFSATVDISSDWIARYGAVANTYGFQTYLHEIGHALGLGHQGPYNGSAVYGRDNIWANDTWQFSVMSYNDQSNYGGSLFNYVITPEMADMAAVQAYYGAPTTRPGDTIYGTHSNAGSLYDFTRYSMGPAFTIYDSGGNDTLDCSNYGYNQKIDLNPGAFSSIGGHTNNVGISPGTLIENAIGGGGNDTIYGNYADNTLTGGGGNDTIDGGAGIDTAVFSGAFSNYRIITNPAIPHWLQTVDLRLGSPDGTDDIINCEYLKFADRTVATGHPPVVSVGSHNLQVNHWSSVAGWISYSDADGDSAMQYQFWNGDASPSAAKVWSAAYGIQMPLNTLTVSAADVAAGHVWVGGATAAGSEAIYVRASDGLYWSDWTPFTLTTVANHAPTLTVNNQSLKLGEWSSVKNWISFSDADGDADMQYQFWNGDTSAGAAKIWSAAYGVQAPQNTLTMSPADVHNDRVWMGGAGAAGSETMYVRAFDGIDWSNWTPFTLTAQPNHAPTATVANHSLAINQWSPLSDHTLQINNSSVANWISYSDADGDSAMQYQFWWGDASPGAAKVWIPAGNQPAFNTLTVSAADVAHGNVWVGGATAAGTETIYVRAFDGHDWSNWDSFHLTIHV